jgi:peptidyl-prolyl cis-trans isomerase SurA
MIDRRVVFLSAFLTVFAAVSRAETPAANDGLDLRFANGIAAIVEDHIITVDDVRREIAPLVDQVRRESHNEKEFNDKLEALQDDIIQNLIDRVLIVKEFYKDKDGQSKRQIPPSYVDNQIADTLFTQFDGDRSKFLAYLRARGLTQRDYRKEVEDDIIYGYMRQQQRKSQSLISPVKVETFYKENKDRFYQEDSVKLRLIQLSRSPGETDDQLRARSDLVVARLKSGEKFEELAREVSTDSRHNKGGDWGWQKRSDLKLEFSEPLFALKKGAYSAAILQPEGAYLLYAEDRKFAGIQTLEEVRDQIENILVQQLARQATEKWLERLRRNGYVRHF